MAGPAHVRRALGLARRLARRVPLGRLDAPLTNAEIERLRTPAVPVRWAPWAIHVSTQGARLLGRLEHPAAAVRLLAWSRRFTEDASIDRRVGLALTRGGAVDVRQVPHVGSMWSPAPADDVAAELLERHIGRPDGDAVLQIELAAAHARLGHHERAGELAGQLAPDDLPPPSLHQLAVVIKSRGKHRGAQLENEADQLRRIYSRVLASRPSDNSARFHLVRSLLARAEFDAAAEVAWPSGPPLPALQTAPDVVPGDAPDDWLFTLHARDLHHGAITRSHRVKSTLAEHVVQRGVRRDATMTERLHLARAHVFIGQTDDARAAMRVRPWHDRNERSVAEKFHADLEHRQGDPDRLIQFVERRLVAPNPLAERTFRASIQDRSVAIVGPAPVDLDAGLDDFDVIVTTKQLSPLDRTDRTVVSYYTDASAILDGAAVQHLLATGRLGVAVVRPTLLAEIRSSPAGRPPFRSMQCEDVTTFMSSRYGVPRIVYDVLRYRPQSVTLLGVDLFAGPDTYRHGYADEVARLFQPNNFETALSLSVHDLADDFCFLDDLAVAGSVRLPGRAGDVISMGLPGYLAALDHVGPASPTGDASPASHDRSVDCAESSRAARPRSESTP